MEKCRDAVEQSGVDGEVIDLRWLDRATFDDEGAWIVSQHGRRSGWAVNMTAEPEVRILQGGTWRTGIGAFRPEDDTHARMRTFAPSAALAGVTASAFRALASDPISVRITFTDAP